MNTPKNTKLGSVESTDLFALLSKWENLAASWLQVAREIDAPDISDRARARAAIYQDCAEDLKANAKCLSDDSACSLSKATKS